jgi:hypothetical protein
MQDRMNGRPRFSSSALYKELEKQRNGMPLRKFCAQIGNVTPATLVRMNNGGNPSVDNLLQFLTYLGTTDLRPFIEDEGSDG